MRFVQIISHVILISGLSSTALAEPIESLPQLTGAYVGCGKTVEGVSLKMVFHLVEMPVDAEQPLVNHWASIIWQPGGTGNIYFSEVRFNRARTRMQMSSPLVARTEHGAISAGVIAAVQSEGILKGEFRTNATNPLTRSLLGGYWEAKRVNQDKVSDELDLLVCN
jgi:hypothetical protein